jgi:hypothetical protein
LLEPVVADLYGDAHAEIVFATWVQKRQSDRKLFMLDYLGNLIQA